MPPESAFHIPHSPVAALGTFALLAAFLLGAYSCAISLVGQRQGRPRLVMSGLYASWAFTALMCFASSVMIYAFLTHDFTIKYVAHYSDTSMSLSYIIASYWGGLDGSLMFWVQILSLFSAVALLVNYRRHRDIIGYVVATIMAVAVFFLALLIYSKNPFTTFLTEPPTDGKGLNPLLQNYWMVIHPPSLYTGFVSMTIPFAFCIAALASGRLDDQWLHSVRVWVMISWFFLSLGLTLGGIWAYEELGWGGYWAWDPVENAGFLPWLTCTAFLHSIMVQERKGMLKVWNVVLMITSFFLTIFGTFMTRSGAVQSVHAFGQDNELAMLFILFMATILIVSFGLLFFRLPALRSTAQFESFVSREFAFLLNNWILLAAAFFVLFATMFPTLSEAVMNERIAVGPPFFNKWMVPIGLTLLFLAGAGPLLAWRQTTQKKLFEQFLFPLSAMAVTIGALAVLVPRTTVRSAFLSDHIMIPVALITFGLVSFSLATVSQEFWRGSRVRAAQTGSDPLTSLIGVVLTKRRKYGGYIVHIGVAIMFLGFAGKAFTQEKDVTLTKKGDTFLLGGLTFRWDGITSADDENKFMLTAHVTAMRGSKVVAVLEPARWSYHHGDQQTTTEIAIDRGLEKDIYLVLNGYDDNQKAANFKLILNPLINWVWMGFGFLALGTAICLVPEALVEALKPRRKTRGGRATEAAVLVLILAGISFGMVRLAHAQAAPTTSDGRVTGPAGPAPAGGEAAGSGATGMITADSPPPDPDSLPPIARRLMGDLVCLCGTCNHRTILECDCTLAARERANIMGLITGKDVSTKAKEDAVYKEVVDIYIAKYGGQHVLNVPIDKGFNRLAWAAPYAVFAGALVLLVAVTGRWVKKGKAAALAEATATANAAPVSASAAALAKNEDLADQLDDELRDLD